VIRQIVIYLKQTNSDLVYQHRFERGATQHEFEVIRLWEQSSEQFLAYTGMLPFAILVNSGNKENLLQEIAKKIDHIPELNTRRTIAAATYVLAGLVLEENIVKQILRRDIMRESVTYQAILQEGRQEGEIKGLKQGLVGVVLRLLTRKFGTVSPKMHTKITRLKIVRLEFLAEAILDFQSFDDLELWFKSK
jgi:predicted transposase YdaD